MWPCCLNLPGVLGLLFSRGAKPRLFDTGDERAVKWNNPLSESPWTARFSAVNQGGRRKGAACVYLETWHADIEQFLELRDNTGNDAFRTHNLNLANWIPDLFYGGGSGMDGCGLCLIPKSYLTWWICMVKNLKRRIWRRRHKSLPQGKLMPEPFIKKC